MCYSKSNKTKLVQLNASNDAAHLHWKTLTDSFFMYIIIVSLRLVNLKGELYY